MKIKNRNFHKKRYLENKMTSFLFPHDKGTKDYIGFCWINGTNYNPINDMKLYLSKKEVDKILKEFLAKDINDNKKIWEDIKKTKISLVRNFNEKIKINKDQLNIFCDDIEFSKGSFLVNKSKQYEYDKKYDKQGYPITPLDRYEAITKLLP